MKSLSPNPDSIVAFLQFKGWSLVRKDKGHFILHPPAGLMVDDDFLLWVPHRENHSAMYNTVVTAILKDIAKLYDWEYSDLKLLLTKNPQELDKIFRQAVQTEQKTAAAKLELEMAS